MKYGIIRGNDCVDTTRFHDEKKRQRYEGLWFGNFKKKLAGCVVPTKDLPNTLMIEDDNSFMRRAFLKAKRTIVASKIEEA